MKISYAITVCNEFVEIQKLVNLIRKNKRQQDEIIVLYDQKNGEEEIATWLSKQSKYPNVQFWRGLDFDGHFANWKNQLTDYCNGDYIFQIDADEFPHKSLLTALPIILESNPDNEVYLVPRVNTVEGLTEEHIKKWRWNVNEKGWVNFPDVQTRIYKNKDTIGWSGKVHERITGFENYTNFPFEEVYCIKHPKTIERQEKQNNYYDTL